ncbi:MAG: hypothetical protein H7839_00460 [Magnetococcus sp. YQC-5]
MTHNPKQDAWIPMADYLYRGVRKPKQRRHAVATKTGSPLPQTWVSLEDHTLHGIRKQQQTSNEEYIQRLKPMPPPPKIPPEAYQTLFDALQEIWALPKSNGPVFSRLRAIQATDQKERATGRITEEEYLRRTAALDAIRTQFAIQAESVTEWFLNNRLRLFDTLPNA